MSRNEIHTVLTRFHERSNQDRQIYCHAQFCWRPIFIGDKVVIKSTRIGTKHYHEECFEKLYVKA